MLRLSVEIPMTLDGGVYAFGGVAEPDVKAVVVGTVEGYAGGVGGADMRAEVLGIAQGGAEVLGHDGAGLLDGVQEAQLLGDGLGLDVGVHQELHTSSSATSRTSSNVAWGQPMAT